MINATPAYLSQEKSDELQAELHRLKMIERKAIAEQLEYAKSLGDLSENAEYHEARDKQADIEDRISELEALLKTAVILAAATGKNKVSIGSRVKIQKGGSGAVEYILVGSEEANIAENKISHQSPLGASLLDKKKGDKIIVVTPKGDVQYTVVDI